MNIQETIIQLTGATKITKIDPIQELWSGYGEISRYHLSGTKHTSVIVKHIHVPDKTKHPHGWDGDISHRRKLASYTIEMAWYENWAHKCKDACRVPALLGTKKYPKNTIIVLEDLDAAGFHKRQCQLSLSGLLPCISWLAAFHATFLFEESKDLWPTGTYWHLDTRREELAALDDMPLKTAAVKIDHLLKDSKFQTIVHGDAKLANFCFSQDNLRVAAVDFQYVGKGVGMKDLVYLVGSALPPDDCEKYEGAMLNHYFSELKYALKETQKIVNTHALEEDWRSLYDVAWADFHRFIKGWRPGHHKINSYSEKLTQRVLERNK